MKQAAEDNAFENSECYEGGRGMRKKKSQQSNPHDLDCLITANYYSTFLDHTLDN